jgi:transglutaminase-like putative cysteine protease
MNIPVSVFTGILFLIFSGCREKSHDCNDMLKQIGTEFRAGNLGSVKILADSIKAVCSDERQLVVKADSFSQIAGRIELDFPVSEKEIDAQLKENAVDFTTEEKTIWEKKNWLECRIINGEKRYFNMADSNLNLIRHFKYQREYYDSLDSREPEMAHRRIHTQSVIKASEKHFRPVDPVEIRIDYTITIVPDAVPAGEIVRCWLPYPKENHPRQRNIRFLSASQEQYIISPDSSVHRTIYMEAKALKGIPLAFNASYSYESCGQYLDPAFQQALSYDKNSEVYKEYTSEQLPHICFTENVRHLADSIPGNEENPFRIVRKIYYWFSKNITWTRALEYSIIPNISEYVLQNRRGDCGMQTFLFMSLLRYKGIPVRWQSGWKVPPYGKNLHDWCEVYFEGPGWVPVDISYGLQYSDNPEIRDFFISGIDSYRLIINDGVSGDLYPAKRFLRSEPYDFQRGEVEWREGNLYFDKWHYEMKITYKE